MSLVQRAVERMNGKAAETPAARTATPRPPADNYPPVPPRPQQQACGQSQDQSHGHPITIPRERLKAAGLIVPGMPRTRLAEEIRLIKRRLTHNGPADAPSATSGQVFMVTSARPSEGKSFIALNLALSLISDEAREVVLVEADVLRPNILSVLGLKPSAGLSDLLRDPSLSLSDVMLHDDMLGLTLIPAGRRASSASELFLGQGMRALFEKLRARHPGATIIFDSPPVLATTEALVLAQEADTVVLVVEAGRTSRSAVEAALELLEPRSNIAMVLNKVPEFEAAEKFGTYYDDYVAAR